MLASRECPINVGNRTPNRQSTGVITMSGVVAEDGWLWIPHGATRHCVRLTAIAQLREATWRHPDTGEDLEATELLTGSGERITKVVEEFNSVFDAAIGVEITGTA